MNERRRPTGAVFLLALVSCLVSLSAAGHTTVWGPKTYSLAANRHQPVTQTFTIDGCEANAAYTLVVLNGNPDGSERVSSGSVVINGAPAATEADFSQGTASIERPIALQRTNAILVVLTGGMQNAHITLSIRRHTDVRQPVLQERRFTTSAKAESFEVTFSATSLNDQFLLVVDRVTAGLKNVVVRLNDETVVRTSDWQPFVITIERPVALRATNRLEFDVAAEGPGATFSVSVMRHVTDVDGPQIETSPPSGSVVPSTPLRLQGAVTDLSGVASLSVNGAAVTPNADGSFSAEIPLRPGENTILLIAADCEGNTTRRELRVTLTTPTSLSIARPAPHEILLTRYVEVTGTVPSGAVVTVNGIAATVAGTTFTATVDLFGREGDRDISVVARTADGAQTTATVPVILDLEPPLVSARIPSGWSRGAVEITFVCIDAGSGVVSCTQPVTLTEDRANQSVTGTAVDRAGRTAAATFTVNIDRVAPSMVLMPSAPITAVPNLVLSGTATDASSGLRFVACNGVATSFTPAGLFTCSAALFEGKNGIVVTAEDQAGNVRSETLEVTLDTTAPVLTVEQPRDALSTNVDSVVVAGTVSDNQAISALTINGTPAPIANGAYSVVLPLADGTNNVAVVAIDAAGNRTMVTRTVTRFSIPTVAIASPADLAVVGSAAITVSGSVGAGAVTLTVNGQPAVVTGGTFRADNVPLQQGRTVITATATNGAGHVATSSINVYRDSIAPRLVIYSPSNAEDLTVQTATVTGMVDDVVVGTINGAQVQVSVNGIEAVVANRAFVARGVPLTAGSNTLTARAVDKGGNVATATVNVTRGGPRSHIEIISGATQEATIGSKLPEPIVVRVVDAAGAAVANARVRFDVMQNNGLVHAGDLAARNVYVQTDATGSASVRWTLGTRAGAGNHRLQASADGFGRAEVVAVARTGAPARIVVDSGSNQFGAVGAPLPRPLVAVVVDAGSNRLGGIPVTFRVLEGGGSFGGNATVTITTDGDGRAWVTPTLGVTAGPGHIVTAEVAGVAQPAVFTATGRVAGASGDTQISGIVLDNLNVPVAGVSLRIDGVAQSVETDTQGHFVIRPAPVGYVKLIVDGSTADRSGTWPTLDFALYTIPGVDNTVGMPIYLLPLDVTRGIQVDERTGGTLTFPELPGFALTIAPGSALFPGGSRAGTVSVTLVHPDKMPMAPGFGQQPRFLITVQPPGVHFDPPAALTLPNLDGLAPGEVTEMYSFDHDLGQFVAIGTASVSADGSLLVSDPGVGIIKGGWHCGGNPSPSGTCDACNPPGSTPSADQGCRRSDGTQCVPDLSRNGQPCTDDGDPCTEEKCEDGTCRHVPMAVDLFSASRYVNRDDRENDWSDAEPLSLGQPLYANDQLGDHVSWKVQVRTLRATVTSYQWKATGPETHIGPTTAEWRIDGIKWKPGFYSVEVKVRFSNGCEIRRVWGQEVGIRTNEYFVVGAILAPDAISTVGVTERTVQTFECGVQLPAVFILANIAGPEGGFNGTDDITNVSYIPKNFPNRHYANMRLLATIANPVPTPDIDLSEGPEDAFGLGSAVNYRFFARAQFKYTVRDGRILSGPFPVGRNVAMIGETPSPCGTGWVGPDFNGVEHPVDNDRVVGGPGSEDFYYIVKVRAGDFDQGGFSFLNGRHLPWVFFKFRFDTSSAELKTRFGAGASEWHGIDGLPGADDGRDFSPAPTIFVYRRDTLTTFSLIERREQDFQTFILQAPVVTPRYPYVYPE